MKLFFKLLMSLVILSCIIECSNPSRPKGLVSEGECPMERINWMKTTSTYSKTTVIDLSVKIGAAAKADAAQIKNLASGDAGISFGDSLTKTINELVTDSVQVSQEFYEAYLTQRQALCNLYELSKSSTFKNDTAFIRKLQSQYFDVTKAFAQVKTDEEKKNQP